MACKHIVLRILGFAFGEIGAMGISIGERSRAASGIRVATGIVWLTALAACASSDSVVDRSLTVELRAGIGLMYPEKLTFRIQIRAVDPVYFGGRELYLEARSADGSSRRFSKSLDGLIQGGSERLVFIHFDKYNIRSWLPAYGCYTINARVGSVTSNVIALDTTVFGGADSHDVRE